MLACHTRLVDYTPFLEMNAEQKCFVGSSNSTETNSNTITKQNTAIESDQSCEGSAHQDRDGSQTALYPAEILPVQFEPHSYSVVCGRGKACLDAPGNHHLVTLSVKFQRRYAQTKSKRKKADIVKELMDLVRSFCPSGQGAFVRLVNGRWWEVSERDARLKVTSMMRDRLHDIYKSSTKSKAAKRKNRLSPTPEKVTRPLKLSVPEDLTGGPNVPLSRVPAAIDLPPMNSELFAEQHQVEPNFVRLSAPVHHTTKYSAPLTSPSLTSVIGEDDEMMDHLHTGFGNVTDLDGDIDESIFDL